MPQNPPETKNTSIISWNRWARAKKNEMRRAVQLGWNELERPVATQQSVCHGYSPALPRHVTGQIPSMPLGQRSYWAGGYRSFCAGTHASAAAPDQAPRITPPLLQQVTFGWKLLDDPKGHPEAANEPHDKHKTYRHGKAKMWEARPSIGGGTLPASPGRPPTQQNMTTHKNMTTVTMAGPGYLPSLRGATHRSPQAAGMRQAAPLRGVEKNLDSP